MTAVAFAAAAPSRMSSDADFSTIATMIEPAKIASANMETAGAPHSIAAFGGSAGVGAGGGVVVVALMPIPFQKYRTCAASNGDAISRYDCPPRRWTTAAP